MRRWAGIAGVSAIIALTGCSSLIQGHYRNKMGHKTAPDFSLTDLDGNTVQLSSFRGRPVVLTFWAYG